MKKYLKYIGLIIMALLINGSLAAQEVNPDPIETMVISHIADTILIDGYSEAAYRDSFQLTTVLTFIAGKYTGGINGSDHSVWMKFGWRDEGIYMFARVKDDKEFGLLDWGQDGIELKINPDTANDGPNHEWKTDAWEIGISRSVDSLYRYYNPTLAGSVGCRNGDTVNSGPLLDLVPGLTFAVINQTGKYTIEALIPWTFILPPDTIDDNPVWPATDIEAWRNKTWGFDIHAADNDLSFENGDRDHCLIWDGDGDPLSTDSDKANKNTALLGQITFGPRTHTTIKSPVISHWMNVYPNPANAYIVFPNPEGAGSIEIYNCHGVKIKTVRINSTIEEVNISDLPGDNIYFFKVNHPSGKTPSTGRFIVN